MANQKYLLITAIIIYFCICMIIEASAMGKREYKSKKDIDNFEMNPALPNRSSCGFRAGFRRVKKSVKITGGEQSNNMEFPWMAHLGYTNDKGTTTWACAGTLINPRYVLTAAHCVSGETIGTLRKNLKFVKLGGNTIIAGVEELSAHPNYNGLATSPNDIALIRMDQEVNYTETIRAICLPEPHESSNVGEKLSVAGWGQTENKTQSMVLLAVEIPFFNQEHCRTTYLSEGVELESSQICAGGEKGKDSCIGDSGGPLMTCLKSNSHQWYQEGIISFGFAQCGLKDVPAVYTKVENFLPWIHSTVKK